MTVDDVAARRTVALHRLPGRRLHEHGRRPTRSPRSGRRPGAEITAFLGGRDDAFFNDLPGFFRSINYAPQFYDVPHARQDVRELPIPKTLLELEGNTLFNYDPAIPRARPRREAGPARRPADLGGRQLRQGRRRQLPVRLQRRGRPGRAATSTRSSSRCRSPSSPSTRRRTGSSTSGARAGCARRRRRSRRSPTTRSGRRTRSRCCAAARLDDELRRYKLVDTVASRSPTPASASGRTTGSSARTTSGWRRRSSGGWPTSAGASARRSTALGLASVFDHDDSPVSVHKTYATAADGLPARPEADLPGAADARRLVEHGRAGHPAAPAVRDLHPQRLRDRHGHHRHLAVRPPAGGPGRHPVPVAVPRHGARSGRHGVLSRDAERPGALGRRPDHAEDAAQPAAPTTSRSCTEFPYLAEPW